MSSSKDIAGGLIAEDSDLPSRSGPDEETLSAPPDKLLEELTGTQSDNGKNLGTEMMELETAGTSTTTESIIATHSPSVTSVSIKYSDIFDFLREKTAGQGQGKQIESCKQFVKTNYGTVRKSAEPELNKHIFNFVCLVRKHWRKHNKNYHKVEKLIQEHLKSSFSVRMIPKRPISVTVSPQQRTMEQVETTPPSQVSAHELQSETPPSSCTSAVLQSEISGTPRATKFRRLKAVSKELKNYSPTTLVKVAARKTQLSGEHKVAQRMRQSLRTSPAKKTKRGKIGKPKVNMTPEEALCLLLDLHLTRDQYTKLKQNSHAHEADIYPCYDYVAKAKNACRPQTTFEVSEGSAKVKLQALLDHTASRIIKVLTEDGQITLPSALKLQCSWGFDGSTGQAVYKQKMDSKWDRGSLFTTHVIPLQLVDSDGNCVWKNPTPQSVRFCRPLKIEFVKETTKVSIAEKKRVEQEIDELANLNLVVAENQVHVSYEMALTLVDGKVLNAITGTKSPLTCPICGVSSSKFNKLEARKKDTIRMDKLQHGISPLHAWIRCFEFIIHIGYRLPVKRWRISGEHDKAVVKKEKKRIQKLFKEKMGLLVDIPKTGGFGSSNDGNTSRRAFADATTFSQITGVDLQLIKDLRTILIAINCDLPLDESKFEILCSEVAARYIALYDWCNMTPTIHKILTHGGLIIKNSIVPIGMLGEEAAEGRNKFYKYNRLHHARKDAPEHTITDVFWRTMDHSDPYLSLYHAAYNRRKHNRKILPPEVVGLLKEPDIVAESNADAATSIAEFSEELAVLLDNEIDLDDC